MRSRTLARIAAILGLLLLLPIIFVSQAAAADFRSGDNITISSDQVIDDDLYLSMNSAIIIGTVNGDVYAAGRTLTVDGTVSGSVVFAGQTLVINGTINDGVLSAAQVTTLGESAKVAEDVAAVGSSLEAKAGSAIGRDVLFIGNQAILAGSVGRDVRGAMGALQISGTVGRDVNVEISGESRPTFMTQFIPGMAYAPPAPSGLTVDASASIGGALHYTSTSEANIQSGAQVAGGATRQESQAGAGGPVGSALSDQAQRFISLLIVGLLLLWLWPRFIEGTGDAVAGRPLASLGWGLLVLVGVFVLVLAVVLVAVFAAIAFGLLTLGQLAALTIGLSIAFNVALVAGLYIFVTFVAEVIISSLSGRLLLGRLGSGQGPNRFLAFVVGLLLYVIVTAIPVIGGLIAFIAIIMAAGGLWLRRRQPPTPEAARVPA